MDSEKSAKFNFPFLMAVLLHFLVIALPALNTKPQLTLSPSITAIQATLLDTNQIRLPKRKKVVDTLAIIKKLSRKEKKYLARLKKEDREKFLMTLSIQLANVEAQKAGKTKESVASKAEKIKQTQDKQVVTSIAAQITRKITDNWIPPLSIKTGLSCNVQIKLTSDGRVMSAEAVSSACNVDELFKKAAENAVNNASPLPVPADSILFEQNFKNFTFAFRT